MKQRNRQLEIVNLLREHGELKIVELAQLLDVSEGTIRNDLDFLEKSKQIERVRGGAILAQTYQISNQAFAARARKQSSNKQRIAHWAANMVKDGEAIFLDASTTAFFMCQYLRQHRAREVPADGLHAVSGDDGLVRSKWSASPTRD